MNYPRNSTLRANLAATSAILLLVAALASVAPALRIPRMDPSETLRSQ